MGKEQKENHQETSEDTSVKQTFRLREIIESSIASVTPVEAVTEMIDNAIDETPEGVTSKTVVTFDRHAPTPNGNGRVSFRNENTTGMDRSKMENFLRWGKSDDDEEDLREQTYVFREHHLGGKFALVKLTDKDQSLVRITSRPMGSRFTHRTEVHNWRSKMSPDEGLPYEKSECDEAEPNGWTNFEVEGVSEEMFPDVPKLADRLGITYGELIQSGRVEIVLLDSRKKPKGFRRDVVLPVTVPLEQPLIGDVGFRAGDADVEVQWGLIDPEERNRCEETRKKEYGIKKVTTIKGDTMYIYVNGKLLKSEPIGNLGVSTHTGGHVLFPFAIVARVKGLVRKTILKDDLDQKDKNAIYREISGLVEADIRSLMEDEKKLKIGEKYRKGMDRASDALSRVLEAYFEGNLEEAVNYLDLATPATRRRRVPTPLPTRTVEKGSGRPTSRKKGKDEAVIYESEKNLQRSLPRIRVGTFDRNYPEAVVTTDTSGQRCVDINDTNPRVESILQRRGKPLVSGLLTVAAQTLFRRTNKEISEGDIEKFLEAMDDDMANFGEQAKDKGFY